ncbi:hypothetical protein TNCV_458071 [Trichonephila clavipes]|nr:hypothetical protein TNCV_458071 [Trichonephila clavipes]
MFDYFNTVSQCFARTNPASMLPGVTKVVQSVPSASTDSILAPQPFFFSSSTTACHKAVSAKLLYPILFGVINCQRVDSQISPGMANK